jgi:hypothetical protein
MPFCQNCSLCKSSKRVNWVKLEIFKNKTWGKQYIMNVGKLKGPEKMLQNDGKRKLQECKSQVLLS